MNHRHRQDSRPLDVTQMHDERTLIDQGVTRGIGAMLRTYGLRLDPVGYDVLAVALIRFLEQQPSFASPTNLVNALGRRAVTLAHTQHQEVA